MDSRDDRAGNYNKRQLEFRKHKWFHTRGNGGEYKRVLKVLSPRYNGAREAGIGAAKRRTEVLAAKQGRDCDWSANDLYAAQLWANEASYPDGFAAGTPASRFAARTPITPNERDTLGTLVLQYERQHNDEACSTGDALTDTLLAVHHRRAVRQALVELGYLDITRRSIPQPIHAVTCASVRSSSRTIRDL